MREALDKSANHFQNYRYIVWAFLSRASSCARKRAFFIRPPGQPDQCIGVEGHALTGAWMPATIIYLRKQADRAT